MRFIALPNGSCRLINKKGRLLPLSALPNPSRVMVIDTIPDGPFDHMDAGPHPTSAERKMYLEGQRLINCGWCPYHRGENGTRLPKHRSWKEHRDSQYHPVNNGGSQWDRAI